MLGECGSRALPRLAAALAFALAVPAGAGAASRATFSGDCRFSGPISPMPAITVVPVAGSHFSYLGTGTCRGALDGAAVSAAPTRVTFTNVATAFDTCELGPDVGLPGTMLIGAGPSPDRFDIVIDLTRLALAGPFTLGSTGGGRALGVAEFQPGDPTAAGRQCTSGGVAQATLAASLSTVSPLVGMRAPSGSAPAPTADRLCVRPRLRLWLRAARDQRIVQVAVFIDGRLALVRTGHRLRSVPLGPLSPAAHTVRVVTRSNRGRVRTTVLKYRACPPARSG